MRVISRICTIAAFALLLVGLFPGFVMAVENGETGHAGVVGTASGSALTIAADDTSDANDAIPVTEIEVKLVPGDEMDIGDALAKQCPEHYDWIFSGAHSDELDVSDNTSIYLLGDALPGKTYTAEFFAKVLDDPDAEIHTVRRFKVSVLALVPSTQIEGSIIWYDDGKLDVRWCKVPRGKCSGYQIQFSTSAAFKNAKTVKAATGATSKVVAVPNVVSRWHVRVRAYKTTNGKTVYSKWSTPVTSQRWWPSLTGSCVVPGGLRVYWNKVPKKLCGGFQVQVSMKESFKGAKSYKVSAGSSSKIVSGLKVGKRYYMRVRAYKKVGGKTVYSAWSFVEQSAPIEMKTALSLARYKYAKESYSRIAKVGKKYGWTVEPLRRSTGYVSSPSGTSDVLLYNINCSNGSYHYWINLDDDHIFWANLTDKNGHLVKEIHNSMAPADVEETWVRSLDKGILADLAKYSKSYKKPRLNVETVRMAEGDKVTIRMLNTKSKVTWDFVREYGLEKEADPENLAAMKKALKLKATSKTSVQFRIVKGAMPYSIFHTDYCLRATVGGKHYYVVIKFRE